MTNVKNLKKIIGNGIAAIPHDLENDYSQLQLKNSLHRIKILNIVMIAVRFIILSVYVITGGNIIDSDKWANIVYSNPLTFYNMESILYIFISSLVIILINIFSKKYGYLMKLF